MTNLGIDAEENNARWLLSVRRYKVMAREQNILNPVAEEELQREELVADEIGYAKFLSFSRK